MNRLWSALRAFVVALTATALLLVVRGLVLVPLLEISAPVMPFLLAVFVAAWIDGTRAGIFATILGAAIGTYLRGPQVPSSDAQLRLVLFVFIGGLMSWALGSRRSARLRALERQQQLELEVEERRKAESLIREQRDKLANEVKRREATECVLREQEERVRLAVEAADIGTWDFNPITGEQQWSSRAKLMFGLSADADLSNVSFRDRVHPDDQEQVNQAVQNALDPNGDGAYQIDCRLVWPDNTVHWFIARGQALFEGEKPNRRATRFIGTVLDITERKHAEEIVRASERRLKGSGSV